MSLIFTLGKHAMLLFFLRLIGSISENRQYFATFTLPALFSIIRGSFFLWKFLLKKKKKKKGSYQLSEIELHMGEIFPEFFLSVKLKEDSVGLDKSNKLWYYSTISTRSLVPFEQFPYLRGVLRGSTGRKKKIVAKDQTSNPCDFI